MSHCPKCGYEARVEAQATAPTDAQHFACIVGNHVEPYLKVHSYYCSVCHRGMGNAYFVMRQKLEAALATAEAARLEAERERDEERRAINKLTLDFANESMRLVGDASNERERADAAESALTALRERVRAAVNVCDSLADEWASGAVVIDKNYAETCADVFRALLHECETSPLTQDKPSPTLICDLCGADRYKEPCGSDRLNCPMQGERDRDAECFRYLQNIPAPKAQSYFWNFGSRTDRRRAILAAALAWAAARALSTADKPKGG